MKYKVLESLIYNGKIYNANDEVEIFEDEVVKNCIERGLIEEVTEKMEEKVKAPKEKTKQVEENGL